MIALRAVWLWVRRRVEVPAGARVLRGRSGSLAVPIAFLVATLIELVVLHLLIPWEWLRWSLAAATIAGLLPVLGSVAAPRVYPSYLLGDQLVLRSAGRLAATVAVGDIARVTPRKRYSPTFPEIADGVLSLADGDGTTVEVDLRTAVTARLTGMFPGMDRDGEVTTVRLSLESPPELIAVLSEHPQR